MGFGKLDVDPARCGCRTELSLGFYDPARSRVSYRHRQQADAARALLAQTALAIKVAPVEHLVGVDPMLLRYPRHRCTRLHRLLDNLALLRDALPLPPRAYSLDQRTDHHPPATQRVLQGDVLANLVRSLRC